MNRKGYAVPYEHERKERVAKKEPFNTAYPYRDNRLSSIGMMERYLSNRGLSAKLAFENGWYLTRDIDRYARIVIPARTFTPGHVYWQARAISNRAKIRYQSPTGSRLSAIVQIEPFAFDFENMVVITEGPLDALASAACGYRSFALMGMSPSFDTIDRLASKLLNPNDLIQVMFDNEPEATQQASYLALQLASLGFTARHFVPPGKDLAAIPFGRRSRLLSIVHSIVKANRKR